MRRCCGCVAFGVVSAVVLLAIAFPIAVEFFDCKTGFGQ